jgi:hypothetical protein
MKHGNLRAVLTLVSSLFLGQTLLGAPLDNWQWRNPQPNGNPQAGPHTLNSVVFANGKFVAVGASGVVSISTDNTNWIEGATATTSNLNSLVYVNGQFVAVGDGGQVEISADGTNWILENSGTTNSLSALAYGNGKFVAVGSSAVIASPNAVNWTPAYSGLSGAQRVAGGSHGFVAVAGNTQAWFSADGLVWTGQTLTAPGNSFYGDQLNNAIVAYANGTFLIGSSRYSTSMSADVFMFYSADGSNWKTNFLGNQVTSSAAFNYNFFMTGSNSVIAAGVAAVYPFLQFSSDGTNWFQTNNVPSPYSFYNVGAGAGAYGNGNYVILGTANYYYSLPPIFTSTDGLNWTNRQHAPTPPTGPTYTFTSIATNNGAYVLVSPNLMGWSSNGLSYAIASNTPALSSVITFSNKFVGVGSGGAIYISSDGLSWTQRNSGTASNLHGITGGGGLLVAVGDAGSIQTSPTGTIWTSRTSGTSLPLYGVIYASGLFVAVGQLGTVLTSPDGISWTGQDSGQLANLWSVTYGSAGFAAVGQGGTIVNSADAVNWTTQNSGTSATLESITFGNGYYLAAGDSATVLTSPDGITWTPRNLGATGGQNFYGAAFLNNRFDVVGAGGTVLESDVIPPLFDVQIHHGGNWLTAFVTPGSNFRIQTCTNLSNPVWTDAKLINNAAAITQWTNPQPA